MGLDVIVSDQRKRRDAAVAMALNTVILQNSRNPVVIGEAARRHCACCRSSAQPGASVAAMAGDWPASNASSALANRVLRGESSE